MDSPWLLDHCGCSCIKYHPRMTTSQEGQNNCDAVGMLWVWDTKKGRTRMDLNFSGSLDWASGRYLLIRIILCFCCLSEIKVSSKTENGNRFCYSPATTSKISTSFSTLTIITQFFHSKCAPPTSHIYTTLLHHNTPCPPPPPPPHQQSLHHTISCFPLPPPPPRSPELRQQASDYQQHAPGS